MVWIFAVSVGLIVYTYFVYPLILLVLAGVKQFSRDLRFGLGRRNRRSLRRSAACPKVSIVFAAHNEAAVIRQKMRNLKAVEYPADQLEILVGCDACTDATARLARDAALPNARVYEFAERGGKPAVLNRLVPLATGELIIFCDANTMFEPGTLFSVVRHFEDPKVGCVCGELRLQAISGKTSSEGFYWRYETLLKFLESRLNMLVGANGAVLGIRRPLFAPIPANGIIDDFLVAMHVRGEGHHVVYDPEAVGWEEVAPNVRQEFRRRVRIGTGNFNALRYTWRMLSPLAGSIAFSYWSHKVCRWLVPLALCGSFVSAAALAPGNLLFAACLAAGVGILALGWAGYRLDLRERYWAPCSIPYYFLSMNLALFLGLLRFLRGRQSLIWSPTGRTVAAAPTPVPAIQTATVSAAANANNVAAERLNVKGAHV
jgi:cellulose synthase/poly-beta-1,6-N-acetylglucosamine synthase-like glycosyltransferase